MYFSKNTPFYRKNEKTSKNSDETLEMEKHQDDKLVFMFIWLFFGMIFYTNAQNTQVSILLLYIHI